MEQAEFVLIIRGITDRVMRLENDVTTLKTHQKNHECQIETLAFAIDRVAKKLEAHDDQFVEVRKEIKFLHTRIDNGFSRMDEHFKLLRDALAL